VAQDHRIETTRVREAAMIKAGDTLMNPVPKERMTFLKTAAETTDQAGCRQT
jgi:hypothetical protein